VHEGSRRAIDAVDAVDAGVRASAAEARSIYVEPDIHRSA
jgi:hypothetical protein